MNFALGKGTSCPRYSVFIRHCSGVAVAVVWGVVVLSGDVDATGKYVWYGVVEVEIIGDWWLTSQIKGNKA